MSGLPEPQDLRIAAPGWSLGAKLWWPAGEPRALFVLHHAMMAHAGAMAPLAAALRARGFAAATVDARGHGHSPPLPPAGDWTFDALVSGDHPASARALRAIAPGLPLIAVGHSLGGQAALAAEATEGPLYDAILILGSGLWGQEGGLLHLQRRGLYELGLALAWPLGRLPTGWFGRWRDESYGYWRQTTGWVRSGRWLRADGLDYGAAVAELKLPIHAFLGEHDPLVRPADQRALVRAAGARFHAVPGADHNRLPRQVVSVLDGLVDGIVEEAAAWRLGRLAPRASSSASPGSALRPP